MASTSQDIEASFAAVKGYLETLDKALTQSFWFRVFDNPKDLPASAVDAKRRKRLEQLSCSSLQKHTGLGRNEYIELFKKIGLVSEKKMQNGPSYSISTKILENLFGGLISTNAPELVQAKPMGLSSGRWYIRLGLKQDGYPTSTVEQADMCVFDPPVTVNIAANR